MDKNEDLTPNCPPPSCEKVLNKLEEKKYFLIFDKTKYELIISLFNNELNKEEIIFNFKLINYEEKILNKIITYENNKTLDELIQLFLINVSKCKNPLKIILEKIEKFHSNKSVNVHNNNNSENSIDLIYTIKTIDNEDLEFRIELFRKEELINKEKKEYLLNQEIEFLKHSLKSMENRYKKIINDQNEEIKLLKGKIDYIMNNFNITKNNNSKIIDLNQDNEENKQLIFKSNLSLFNKIKAIQVGIDGSRGVNDHFEVYNLYKEKKSVYIAIKCKEIDDDISYIDVIKITSVNNYKKILRLKGHQKRIVFIKYFINPYTKKEYLISGDREEKIRVWEIINENNYKSLCLINTNYGRLIMQQSIYNCILYFTENKNYIYTSTVTNNYSRLYELEDGAFLKDISITYYNYTFYLIRYKDFIIDCCRNNIIIYQPFNEEIYAKIENSQTKGDNRSACIIYNKNNMDYLYISNSNGFVISFNLKKKCINQILDLNKDLYHIIFWNYRYLIVAEYDSEYIEIIDLENKNSKNEIKCNTTLMCVKKILLNENEEILLTSGENNGNLYIIFSSDDSDTPYSNQKNNII